MKVKKLLTLTGDVKMIFKLQDINLSLNKFLKFLSNLKRSTSQKRYLNKNISFRNIWNHKFRCIWFIKKWFNTRIYEIQGVIVFYKDSLQMVNFKMKCLEITTYAKTPMKWSVWKSSLLVRWNETFIIGESPAKCWFSVNTSNKFTVFTTYFDV